MFYGDHFIQHLSVRLSVVILCKIFLCNLKVIHLISWWSSDGHILFPFLPCNSTACGYFSSKSAQMYLKVCQDHDQKSYLLFQGLWIGTDYFPFCLSNQLPMDRFPSKFAQMFFITFIPLIMLFQGQVQDKHIIL